MFRLFFFIVLISIGCKEKPVPKPILPLIVKIDSTIKTNIKPILILDAGHGAVDPGAINDSLKLYEKNLTRKIVDAVLAIIDTNKITVIQTRPADQNIHRHKRIELATKYNPNMLLTVHINNDKDTLYNGFEVGISDSIVTHMDEDDTISISNPNILIASKMALTLSRKVAKSFPLMRNRNVKKRKDRIWMICSGKFPSVLLEFGFLSSNKDLVYLTDKKAIKKLASSIVNAVYEELLPKPKTKIAKA